MAEPPGQAGWIALAVSQRPVAYLATMSVRPDERGSGVGTALLARLHRELDAAAAACSLYREKDGHLNVELIRWPNQPLTRPTTRPLPGALVLLA